MAAPTHRHPIYLSPERYDPFLKLPRERAPSSTSLRKMLEYLTADILTALAGTAARPLLQQYSTMQEALHRRARVHAWPFALHDGHLYENQHRQLPLPQRGVALRLEDGRPVVLLENGWEYSAGRAGRWVSDYTPYLEHDFTLTFPREDGESAMQ